MHAPAQLQRTFPAALRAFQLRWRAGLLLAGVLRALFFAGLALLAFGLLDFHASFSDPMRRIVAGALAAIAAAGVIAALWQALLFLRRDAAAAADEALGTGRRSALSALELRRTAADAAEHSLDGWLRARAVQGAADQLATVRGARALPIRKITRCAWQAGAAVLALGLCALLVPQASSIIAKRLLQPGADIPPYSRLRFSLDPHQAEVLYGGEIVVTAEITGGKLDAPVRCLTRDPATGKIEDSPAFHENAGRFSRKLEKVAAPVDVAFAVGRARSEWLPVAVRMQPKVQEVFLTIEPPAYSGRPRREFAVGAQEIAPLPGSRITARVSSNRPLSGGALQIESLGANAPPEEIAAEPEQTHRVRFTWIARRPGRLSIELRDVLGTKSDPLVLEQRMTPDERPQAALRQPSGDVLATPDTELPLEATASDDLGLTRVTFVRQLHGYRERARAESTPPGGRRFDFTGRLNLAPYGLQPGQTIELTVEAGDSNPNLLGVSASEPARIHIIDREQYAELLRSQTTLDDFSGRYEALREAMDAARKSLEALDAAAQSGDGAAAEAARAAALEAHNRAGKIFGGIAKDFPLFDLDESLAQASGEAMRLLFENAVELESLAQAAPDDLLDALPQLRERLGAGEAAITDEMEQGQRALAAAEVFEQAGRFRELIAEQRGLVKDFNRVLEQIRRGETQAGQGLRDLARQQAEIAGALREFSGKLRAAIEALPEEFSPMAEEGRKFLELLDEFEIPPTMDEGAAAAEAGDGKTGGDRAGEALARLEALLRQKNGFCAMCRGEGEAGFPWPQDLSLTLEQLMRALIQRPGPGGDGDQPGAGGAGGPGGLSWRSNSGFSMRGRLPQLPIYGPARQRFARNANPQLGGANGTGGRQGSPEAGADVNASEPGAQNAREPAGSALSFDAVPEAYRDAVKRYFSAEEKR